MALLADAAVQVVEAKCVTTRSRKWVCISTTTSSSIPAGIYFSLFVELYIKSKSASYHAMFQNDSN